MDESSENKSTISPPSPSSSPAVDFGVLEKVRPIAGDSAVEWADYAVQQAVMAQKTLVETLESTVSVAKSRLDQIRSTSTAHLHMTIVVSKPVEKEFLTSIDAYKHMLKGAAAPGYKVAPPLGGVAVRGGATRGESLQDLKSDYNAYEDIVFGKIKEGVYFAASHPFATSGLVVGSGILAVKGTRRSLYFNTLRLFVSDEAMLARANAKVQKLRESVRTLTEESKKLEKFSLDAEVELKRGRTKLRQTGKQIQGVIDSAYKIERQAGGMQ
ncbi:hypothetical protein OSB04_012656 [Centaurea solstitialis]|uniref:Uncharacterized protein n=1 Tax=Centaurea solstitialis TaxID=347529 RepID=A0AA38TUU3_9ASTR|nr:hypothetical protein OSB04_012656 [Centaurea solstitialis]